MSPPRLASWTLAALLLPACGWHAGLELPPGASSVGVEFFDNQTPEPDLEAELASELGQFLVSHLQAPLVRTDRADVVVRGVLEQFRRRGGARSDTNRPLESSVRIDVRAELVDRHSGEVLARSSSGVWSSYSLNQIASESLARRRALRHVAESLALDLFGRQQLPERQPEPSVALKQR